MFLSYRIKDEIVELRLVCKMQNLVFFSDLESLHDDLFLIGICGGIYKVKRPFTESAKSPFN